MRQKGISSTLIVVIIAIIAATIAAAIFIWVSEKNKKSNIENVNIPEQTSQERKIVALGDSITKANNVSKDMPGDNDSYSFAVGTEINSVYQYLIDSGENLTAVNLAVSGATSKDVLENQVPAVANLDPKYITLLVGANDILQGVTLDDFKKNLSEIIIQINVNDATILVGAIPDITKMQQASYPACKENKLGQNLENLGQAYIQNYNSAIREIASQNNLIFVDTFDILGADDVSEVDCIHPNISGQEKLASEFVKSLAATQ